jgi:hypothetical protein
MTIHRNEINEFLKQMNVFPDYCKDAQKYNFHNSTQYTQSIVESGLIRIVGNSWGEEIVVPKHHSESRIGDYLQY